MQIVEKGSFMVVGIEVVAPWKALWTEVPKAWEALRARSTEIRNRKSEVFMDVSVEQRDGVYTQVVGAETSSLEDVPEGMIALEVPAQHYVHLRHKEPIRGIADGFGRIYEWAKERGHVLDAFKLDVGYTQEGGESEHDLYVRLVSRA